MARSESLGQLKSNDPAVIERGRHVADALMPCSNVNCHGADLAGGKPIDFGPIGLVTGPNITKANVGVAYSDGELARLLRHGLKEPMPRDSFKGWDDTERHAIWAYLQSLPATPLGGR